jgi:hypothetical protein
MSRPESETVVAPQTSYWGNALDPTGIMKLHDDKHEDTNEDKSRGLGLSPAQVTGSALAAMSGAFFVSWAGTTGTLIGAAAGSVIATVGAATYTWSLRRTSAAVRRTAAQVRQAGLVTGAYPRTVSDGPLRDDEAQQPSASAEVPEERRRFDLPWARVALVSLAVMVLGMAGITVVEAVTGSPIASVFGKDEGSGTTVGRVVGSDSGSSKQEKAPAKQAPTPTPTPSEQPSQQPQQQEPSTTPVPTPSPTPSVPVPPVDSQAPQPDGTASQGTQP